MRKVLPALFLLLPLTISASHAQEAGRAELIVQATASSACAPWDGQAVDIKITWPETAHPHILEPNDRISITLWNEGLTKLTAGGTVQLTMTGDMKGDGQLAICPKGASCFYPGGVLTLNPGSTTRPVTGTLHWLQGDKAGLSEQTVKFSAEWTNDSPQECG